MEELIVLEHPARVEKRRPRPARQELSLWRLPWLQQIPPRQEVQRVWMRQAAPSLQVELPNGPVNLHKWGPNPFPQDVRLCLQGPPFPPFWPSVFVEALDWRLIVRISIIGIVRRTRTARSHHDSMTFVNAIPPDGFVLLRLNARPLILLLGVINPAIDQFEAHQAQIYLTRVQDLHSCFRPSRLG